MPNKTNRAQSRFALLGGLIHVAAAIGILFFPVFTTCLDQKCYSQSYIEMGGNALGYIFLGLMILAGSAAIYSSFLSDARRATLIRVLVVLASAIGIAAGLSIGIVLVPGALLVLLGILIQGR